MGKLFWKFFIIFWLAQIVTVFGVGIAVWALRPDMPRPFMSEMHAPPVPMEGYRGMPHPPGMQEGIPPPRPLGEQHPSKRQGLLPPLLPIVAGSVVSLIFAALLAWYFARPIRSLRKAFDEVAKGRLDTRIGGALGGRKDELADLGQDFDRMASRLQGLMDAQRRLLHDVSHELRSPLARLQAVADLMQQQPERAAELIPRLERDTGRIDTLVGELLTLARLDSGMAGKMEEQIDLHELIEHIVVDASFEAGTKQCVVQASLPEHMQVKGNQELLFRALENVVRNAISHTPAGKKILLSAKQSAGKWLISIEDEGPGVMSSELENIFQPFFRGKVNGLPGYGLGLAITQRVVLAHGGEVKAVNRPEGGLRVEIVLPSA